MKRIMQYNLIVILVFLTLGCFEFLKTSAIEKEINTIIDDIIVNNQQCPLGFECDFFQAPKDYYNVNSEMINIYYGVHKAESIETRKGLLFINFGGPGMNAVLAADNSQYLSKLPKEIVSDFDLVFMDPRGAGGSAFFKELLMCSKKEIMELFQLQKNKNKSNLETDDVIKSQFLGCQDIVDNIFPFMGTNSIAKDMDRLRNILGEEQISYIGYSYGTRLGSIYSAMFPERMRAFILDSNLSPIDLNHHNNILLHKVRNREDILRYRYGQKAVDKLKDMIQIVFSDKEYITSDGIVVSKKDLEEILQEYVLIEDIDPSDDPLNKQVHQHIEALNRALFNDDVFTDYHELLHKAKKNVAEMNENIDVKKLVASLLEQYRFFMMNTIVYNADELALENMLSASFLRQLTRQASSIYGYLEESMINKLLKDQKVLMSARRDPVSHLENINTQLGQKKVLLFGIKYDTKTPYIMSEHMKETYGNNSILVTVDNLVQHGISFMFSGFDCVNNIATQYLLDPTKDFHDMICDFSDYK